MSLANAFPPALVHRYALQPGRILYLFCNFTTPPKQKYLVVVSPAGDTHPPLFFVINSRIHPYLQSSPALAACQICITPQDYPSLNHASYIDCSKVIYSLSEQEILSQIDQDGRSIKDTLLPATIGQILAVVSMAETISLYHQRLILSALSTP